MVQPWQKVAANRKAGKVAKAVVEAAMKAVEAAATEDAVVDAAVGAGETTAEAVTAAEADGAAMEWSSFLAATEEAEEGWWQQQAADKDMMQWVQEVEQQAAAGEAEMVGPMVEAATEAGANRGCACDLLLNMMKPVFPAKKEVLQNHCSVDNIAKFK